MEISPPKNGNETEITQAIFGNGMETEWKFFGNVCKSWTFFGNFQKNSEKIPKKFHFQRGHFLTLEIFESLQNFQFISDLFPILTRKISEKFLKNFHFLVFFF